MNTREKVKRRVIELIHGLPYEEYYEKNKVECIDCKGTGIYAPPHKLEEKCDYCNGDGYKFSYFPITIGRVMQALEEKREPIKQQFSICTKGYLTVYKFEKGEEEVVDQICWTFTKENGQECTDDDQTDETINKLYKLMK